MAYAISKLWFYPLSRPFIRKINGIENIPLETPFIIAANHERFLDPCLITYVILRKLNRKIHFLARPSPWFIPSILERNYAGNIPLLNPGQAFQDMKDLLKKREIIGIFPEGERVITPSKNPKTGAVRLAIETNTPILPIGIKFSFMLFGSTINIGKLVRLNGNKDVKKQTLNLMKYIYKLKNDL